MKIVWYQLVNVIQREKFQSQEKHCEKEPIKGRCLLIKDIFALVCNYAGNVDLNKCYRNPKRKCGVTMHFSKTIHKQYYFVKSFKIQSNVWRSFSN